MWLCGVCIKAQNDVLNLHAIYVEKRLIHSLVGTIHHFSTIVYIKSSAKSMYKYALYHEYINILFTTSATSFFSNHLAVKNDSAANQAS